MRALTLFPPECSFIGHGGTGSWEGAMLNLCISPDRVGRIAQRILSLPLQAPPGSLGRGMP